MGNIIILGSTGSIGTQSLKAIHDLKGYKVIGLACNSSIDVLSSQIKEFNPMYVYTKLKNESLIEEFPFVKFFYGDKGLNKLVRVKEADTILNSLVGSVGLIPTLEAIKHKKKVLLANKETLVVGGEIVKKYLKKYNGTLYPIDSEHSSLWELLDKYNKEDIESYTITASGGPFRDLKKEELENVTVKDALKHPNWKMGSKITIDSSTMMNKGFEVIEAHYLFDIPIEKIKTIINKESLVHSMIELKSGEIIKGIDEVSMRNPIVRALYYPEIKYKKENHNDNEFTFIELDHSKYPNLDLAYKAIKEKGVMPAVLNASNEIAVKLFLDSLIKYTDIYKINDFSLKYFKNKKRSTLYNISKYDKLVKDYLLKHYKEVI